MNTRVEQILTMGPLVLVFVIALWSVWPMVGNSKLITNIGSDGWLLTWIMNQPLLSFQGNAFYPYQNVLAYSDMHKISALVAGGSFAQALVLGQVATMVVVYLWWKSWIKNGWAAAVGSIALGLSQIRWEYQVHLQMWSMQYWLFGSWLVSSYLTDAKKWKLYLGAVLVGLQIYESPLPLYFVAALLAVKFWTQGLRLNRHLVIAAIVFLAVVFPAARVYAGVAGEFNFTRDIREAAHNSMSINDLWGKFWSPGLVAILAVALLRSRWGDKPRWVVAILLLGLVMALGPVVKWRDKTVKIFNTPLPLPYAAAYYLVPGVQAFRTPSRWLWLTAFAASGLIAAGLKNLSAKKLWLPVLVAIVAGTRLTSILSLPERVPGVYRWLKNQPGKIVLELPVYTWPKEQVEVERLYYSLYHGKTLVNGFSGFTPPLIFRLAQDPLAHLPQGVDYIVDHRSGLTLPGKIVYSDEENTVYIGGN